MICRYPHARRHWAECICWINCSLPKAARLPRKRSVILDGSCPALPPFAHSLSALSAALLVVIGGFRLFCAILQPFELYLCGLFVLKSL